MEDKAIFYGVSVGPGDPQLITLAALRAVEACPVIAAPQAPSGRTLALDILRGAADLTGKAILPLPLAMTRDKAILEEEYRHAADLVRPHLQAGRSVAMLTLGDVSVYSTVHYLLKILTGEGWPARLIPGVPSFCAAAASLGRSLTTMDKPLHILPAGAWELEDALALPGSKVLMKSGRRLPQVVARLSQKPGLHPALALNCGLEDEYLCPDFADYDGRQSYFATFLVEGEETP